MTESATVANIVMKELITIKFFGDQGEFGMGRGNLAHREIK